MKIELYDGKQSESVVRLQVVQEDDGVQIIAVDEYGKKITSGNICKITSFGIYLNCSVNGSLGFPLDRRGQLKVY